MFNMDSSANDQPIVEATETTATVDTTTTAETTPPDSTDTAQVETQPNDHQENSEDDKNAEDNSVEVNRIDPAESVGENFKINLNDGSEPKEKSNSPSELFQEGPASGSYDPDKPEPFDVFHWANEVDEMKNNISVELFLFNKNYTPYKVRYSDQLTATVKAMFMQEATGFIIKEADKGLECREFEKSDGEENVIYRTSLSKVGRAETLIHLIEKEYRNIDSFTDHTDEFKKVKGILARFTYPGGEAGQKVFYIAKAISPSSALKGATSWELNSDNFEPFSAEVALKMPADNQVAIIDGTVVIFNQARFEALFQYNYKSQVIADAKAKELSEKYKLSFAEGLTLNSLLQDRKPLVKKLQSLDINEQMPQDKLIDYADEMQLELMTDDDGSIIIMDDKDLNMFINLLAEDYFISPVNGRRYEIKSKKLLSEPDGGEPPRG